MAIKSFGDPITEEFFYSGKLPAKGCGWKARSAVAGRKLDMLDAGGELMDLRSPPGNKLKKLSGDLKDSYSIRINDQWRIIFEWTEEGPVEVRIEDYH